MVLLFVAMGVHSTEKSLVLDVPEAQASVSSSGDVAKDYSSTQKRYIQRALLARHDNLYKMDGASLRAVLENPGLVRADLPTVVWQYRNEACVLDVYFKVKNEQDKADLEPVAYYEMRSRRIDEAHVDEQACLASLMPPANAPRMLGVNSIYKSYIR